MELNILKMKKRPLKVIPESFGIKQIENTRATQYLHRGVAQYDRYDMYLTYS